MSAREGLRAPGAAGAGTDLVVAEGQHEERRRRVDPPAEVLQRVERRLVGPVHVLEDADGRSARSTSRSAPKNAFAPRPRSVARPKSSSRRTMSYTGPSGRGVKSASHAPQRTRTSLSWRAVNAWTRDVLPTPASPPTRATRPAPRRARSRSASSWAFASSRSRSWRRPPRRPSRPDRAQRVDSSQPWRR